MGDAEATAILFHKMIKKDSSFLHDLKYENYLADHLNIDRFPNVPGIYYFKNSDGNIIYIGKSKQIKNRIRTHLNNVRTTKGLSIIESIEKVEIMKTENHTMALLYENLEIKRHQPIYNKAQKNTVFPFGLFLDKSTEFHTFYIKSVENNDTPIIGFKSKKEGREHLSKITYEYRLCEKINGFQKAPEGKACFGYQIKTCNGACINKEQTKKYNSRVSSFLINKGITNKNYIFISEPFKKEKRAFVVVKKGIIIGFGYGQKNTNYNNVDQLVLLSESFNPDKDFQNVLKHLMIDSTFTKKPFN